jgi:hypothetical protein
VSKVVTGEKGDAGKPAIYSNLLNMFPLTCLAVAQASAFGAERYGHDNWRAVPDGVNRYSDALLRHLLEDGLDPASGLPHEAHAAWNALARCELLLREVKAEEERSDA